VKRADAVSRLAAALFLAAAAALDAWAQAPMPQFTAGQPLEEALSSLNVQGHRIAFSSALVQPGMRLASAPDAVEIEPLLRQLLEPWGLVAERMPRGGYRVVRAARRSAPAAGGTDAGHGVLLAEVDVTAARYGLVDADADVPLFLDRAQIAAYPHLTDDALRAVRVLPGISGGDFSARLHVRGGRRDEVAVRVDGVEMHDPFHLRELDGPIGLLDTNLVERLNLTTGGLTADFGGRMSGLVEIETRVPQVGDADRHALGISFVNAFARSGGRFADERGWYLLALRRGYLDLVLDRVADDDEEFAPRYYDAVARLGYELGERTALTAGVLVGRDDMTFVTDGGVEDSAGKADTAHFWLTLDHEFAGGLQTSAMFAGGSAGQERAAVKDDPGALFADLDMTRELQFANWRQDFSWPLSERQLLRFGASAARYQADYDYDLISFILDPSITGGPPQDTSRSAALEAETTELAAWAAWRAQLADGLFGEFGLRYELFGGDLDASRLSPRLNLVYDPGGSRQYRLALSRLHQPQRADELQVEDGVTQFFGPERADQLSLGMTQKIGRHATLRIDAYLKRYDGLRPRFENLLDSLELINEAEPDRVRVDAAEARAHGVELSLQASPWERSNLWASYVYSRSEDREDGADFPRLWDQEHALTGGYAWTGDRWRFSLGWNWHSGWPTTPVTAEETVDPDGNPLVRGLLGERNSARLGSFARIDLRASRTSRTASGALTWYLEIYNLLDAKNPCCVEDFDLAGVPGGLIALPNHDYWLPVLPSFGIQYEF
jgi:hypothetical protein